VVGKRYGSAVRIGGGFTITEIPASTLVMALGRHGTALVMRTSRRTPAVRSG
jgi:hypothetical protein